MKRETELIKMIEEIIYDYGATGGIMPNTLDKAKSLINYEAPIEGQNVSDNEKSKEVFRNITCGKCGKKFKIFSDTKKHKCSEKND